MAEKKKINWLLILQGWAMLWVVIGHSFLGVFKEGPALENALCTFAYSFHMPLFMLVSGWLFYLTRLKHNEITPPQSRLSDNGYWLKNRWTYGAIVKDKAVRLLLPGLVFTIISFALKLAFPGEMSRQVGLNLNDVVHTVLYPYDNPFREFWFIATLFWFFLMTPLWKVVLSSEWAKWGTLGVLVVLYFCYPAIELFCIGRVFNYAIWFYLGLLISEEDWVDKYLADRKWLVLFGGIAVYAGSRFLVHGEWLPKIASFLSTIGGITMSFGLALIADKYVPKLFCGFRNYTYQIFLMGILAQMFVKIMYRHVSMSYVGAYLICLFVGLYVPVLVSKVIERINWKPLSLCVGLK